MRLLISVFYPLLAMFLTAHSVSAQVLAQSAHYRSSLDESLTLRKLTVLPISDNVSGIYARPLEDELIKLVKENHHWDYRPINYVGPVPIIEDLEESPSQAQKITAGTDIDGFIISRIVKGPKGISMKLDLFGQSDGRLLAQETIKNVRFYDIPQLQSEMRKLFYKVISRIPYTGLVLSRRNNRVTLNLGSKDGVQPNETISAIQIIKTQRHPKFGFIVSTEKEILGKVKILKVEETLSFGTIVTEKERGSIQKWTKLSNKPSIKYDAPNSLEETARARQDHRSKLDNDVAFGKNAAEWVPVNPPTFGMASLLLGFGTYNGSTTLDTQGALESGSNFYPTIGLEAEMWINPEWALDFHWSQGITSTDNPIAGSSPEKINHSVSNMGLFVAYNFLLQENFFGPKIQILGGVSRYADSVDDTDPRSLTSFVYSGPTLGIRGMMPVTPDKKWEVGLQFHIMLLTSLSEEPVTSGSSSSNTVNDFKFFVNRKLAQNLLITGRLNFLLTRASFNGDGSRSDDASVASQKSTSLSGGVTYMF